jgi:hypothetical protein
MNTLERTILDALTRFLMDRGVTDIVRVTGFEDRTEYGGGCETCEYTYTVVDIYYDRILAASGQGVYTYDGSFSELIAALTV